MAKHKAKERIFNIGKKLFPIAKGLAPVVSFIDQISAKDRQTLGSTFTTAPTMEKFKMLSNIITGRLTGIHFFNNGVNPPQTINPAGILNKWTNAGGIMLAYGFLGSKLNQIAGMGIAPATGKIKSIGKGLIVGGGIGGFFDDPPNSTNTQNGKFYVSNFNSQTNQIQMTSNGYSTNTDSTESSFN